MSKYEIIYTPHSGAAKLGLDSTVEADSHSVKGKFVVFAKDADTVLQVNAAWVAQVKKVE